MFDGHFQSLSASIAATLARNPDSGWQLSHYRWEEDAATGSVDPSNYPNPHPVNPSEAATIAHCHGLHLGELIAKWGSVRKVHLIAHSAGAWAARAAARHLLQYSGIQVQITLLDPFVPGAMTGNQTPFNNGLISALPSLDPMKSRQLYFLENFYALDLDGASTSVPWIGPIATWFGTDIGYAATGQIFNWSSSGG